MTTENRESVESRSPRRSGIGFVSKVLPILVLYALSLPPVRCAIEWIDYSYSSLTSNDRLTLGEELAILGIIYYPLLWLMEENQSFNDLYTWYLHLSLWDHLDPPTA